MKNILFWTFLVLSLHSFSQQPISLDAPRNLSRGSSSDIQFLKSDKNGGVYQIGIFKDSIQFAYKEDMLYSENLYDVFIRKIDSEGNTLWAKNFNIGLQDYISSVTIIDSSIYLLYGNVIRNFDLFGNSRYYYTMATLDLNGVIKSKYNHSLLGDLYINDLCLKNENEFLAVITFSDSTIVRINDKDSVLRNTNNLGGAAIVSLNTKGKITFLNRIESNDYCNPSKIIKNENNMYFLAGSFNGTLADSFQSNGFADVFIAKCDSLGNINKIKTFGSTSNDWFNSINSKDNGIYVASTMARDFFLEGSEYVIQGGSATLVSLNLELEVQKVLKPGYRAIQDIAFSNDDVIITGNINNEDSFFRDDKTILYSSVAGAAGFVTKYDNNLNWLWSQSLVGESSFSFSLGSKFNTLLVLDNNIYASGVSSYGTYRFDLIHQKYLSTTSDVQDKAISIKLKDCHLNPSIERNGGLLKSVQQDAEYLWLKFQSGYKEIWEEKQQTYRPQEPGIYAVRITKDGCSALSEFVNINTVGISEKVNLINIYPNPVKEFIKIDLPFNSELEFTIIDLSGKVVSQGKTVSNQINTENIITGNYTIAIQQLGQIYVARFIKL